MSSSLSGWSAGRARGRSALLFAAVGMVILLVSGCGPKISGPRVDDSDYVFPDLIRGEMSSREETSLRRAWEYVLVGQTDRADQTLSKLLASRPGLRPAQVVAAFAALRANRLDDAGTMFASALGPDQTDVAAMMGLASVKRQQGLLDQALPLYLKAERLRPRDAALARRASEVKLAVAEGAISRAGSLSAEGRKPEAIAMLQKALAVAPELSPVRLELADLLVEAGRRPEALLVLAAAQDGDRSIAIRIATLRFEDRDLDGAEMALRRGVKDVADDAEGAALLARIKERRALLALPEPLRAIADAPRITRAELAALVVVRVEALKTKKAVKAAEVASDLSRTWARSEILRALDLGLMDVYPNHTFQPSGVIRRGELAVVASRVLDLLSFGRANASPPRDMSLSHLQYGPVVRVLSAGVMQNTGSGAFEPWRIVLGSEAKTVVDALTRLSAQR